VHFQQCPLSSAGENPINDVIEAQSHRSAYGGNWPTAAYAVWSGKRRKLQLAIGDKLSGDWAAIKTEATSDDYVGDHSAM
jgi:hypothetical protein